MVIGWNVLLVTQFIGIELIQAIAQLLWKYCNIKYKLNKNIKDKLYNVVKSKIKVTKCIKKNNLI